MASDTATDVSAASGDQPLELSSGLSIGPFFEADITLTRAMKDALVSKYAADKHYCQEMEAAIRNARKFILTMSHQTEAANIWSAFNDDLSKAFVSMSANLAATERLINELQAICNIRENQKKMLETEYSAIVKFVQKEQKKFTDLKKDLNRLYDSCVLGLNSFEKSKQKGKVSEKEKSLLQHNLIRLHETHNSCLIALQDVKYAKELANNVHLPAMRRFIEITYRHYIVAFRKIICDIAEATASSGHALANAGDDTKSRLSELDPYALARNQLQFLRINNVTEPDPPDLSSSVYALAKSDMRLQALNKEQIFLFSETRTSLDESLARFRNDIEGQDSKKQRLESSLADKNARLAEYLRGEDASISGLFARECEIAKLETECFGIEDVKASFSERMAFVQSAKSENAVIPSLTSFFFDSPDSPPTSPDDSTCTQDNSHAPQVPEAEANVENVTSSIEKPAKFSKEKFQGFFKNVKRNIVSKIRHETLQDMTDDENASNGTDKTDGNSRRTGSCNQLDANGKVSDDGNSTSGEEAGPFWWFQVRDLPYFHGILPRADIDRLFQKHGNKNGDFIVRESILEADKEKVLILSVYWDQPRHFRLASQSRPLTAWKLNGLRDFATVGDLIKYHVESGEKVSENLVVRLTRPLNRSAEFLQNDWIVLGRTIGQGAYGAVYLASFRPPTLPHSLDVAVKVLKPKFAMMNKEEKTAFINEARQMQHLEHPNIVRFIGVAATREPMMLVMELCDRGSLLALLRSEGASLPLTEMYRFAFEAAFGMEYLSEMRVIHRDLAARNCLISKHGMLKISDFGLSRRSPADSPDGNCLEETGPIYQPQTPVKIPIRWTAPETFFRNVYTSATDVWSYGIMLWEIFDGGTMPWPSCRTNDRARDAIQSGDGHPRPERMPLSFYETVMLKCLSFDPESRSCFSTICTVVNDFLLCGSSPPNKANEPYSDPNASSQSGIKTEPESPPLPRPRPRRK